jgi:hypothetical protein
MQLLILHLFFLLGNNLLFILKLDCVQVQNQTCVFLCLLLDVGHHPLVVLDSVGPVLSEGPLHVSELSCQLFDYFWVFLLLVA